MSPNRLRVFSMVCLACGGILAFGLVALQHSVATAQNAFGRGRGDDERPIVQRFAGGGQWRQQVGSGRQSVAADGKPWRVHAVRRDDGSVRAKLSVPGVPGFDDLTVEGQVTGDDAYGVLLDGDGVQIGTFNAKLAADGNGGSFILGTGESGTWDYDGPTQAAVQPAALPAQ